jgi:hypothetical protein
MLMVTGCQQTLSGNMPAGQGRLRLFLQAAISQPIRQILTDDFRIVEICVWNTGKKQLRLGHLRQIHGDYTTCMEICGNGAGEKWQIVLLYS